MRHFLTRAVWLTPILCLAAFTVVLVPPHGEFPLNDDWVYYGMVREMVEYGRLAVHPYSSAYAATQVVLAAPVAMLFGLSFTLLRSLTMLLGLGVLVATFWCARISGLSRTQSLAASLVLAVNPLFINMSYTFMTEVPFMLLAMLSVGLYMQSLRRPSFGHIAAATAFAVLAFLNRQYGLLLTLAFLSTVVVYRRWANPHASIPNAIAVVKPWVLCIPCAYYLAQTSQTDLLAYAVTQADWGILLLPYRAAMVIASATLYCGLFLMPITLPLLVALFRRKDRWTKSQCAAASAVAAGLAAFAAVAAGPLPNLPNVIRDFGLGPLLLSDPEISAGKWSPLHLGDRLWWPLTVLSALSAGVLAGHVVGHPAMAWRNAAQPLRVRYCQRLFLFTAGILIMLAPINAVQPVYHDRYILPALPMFAILAAAALPARALAIKPWVAAIGTAPALLFYAFSVAGQQDYLAWNQARWDAVHNLRTTHSLSYDYIDGGYEFNGLHSGQWSINVNDAKRKNATRRRMWIDPDEICTVVMRCPEGKVPVIRVPYYSWLGFQVREIVALRRGAVSPPESRYRHESVTDPH